MARCGVAVYGLDPFQGDPAERGLEPAMSLRSYVADVKRFAARRQRRLRPDLEGARPTTWVGVLPIGYGDGVRRGLSNNAEVLVRGRRHPLVGTVSMDNVTIDLGPETDVEPGDEAVLIGAQGEERDPRRGGGAAPRHDQLRGHLRDLRPRPARGSLMDRGRSALAGRAGRRARAPRARRMAPASGSPAARCATQPWAAR